MRILAAAALALAFTAFVSLGGFNAVYAQTATVVVAEPTIVQQIISAALPTILAALGGLAIMLINKAANLLKEKTGIEIEQAHRDALHQALLTGVRLALVRLGWVPGTEVPQQAISMAVDHARSSVPDAINTLHPDTATLHKIAESKAPMATAEVAASGPEPVKVSK